MDQVEELRAEIRKDNEWIRDAMAREEKLKDHVARLESFLRAIAFAPEGSVSDSVRHRAKQLLGLVS